MFNAMHKDLVQEAQQHWKTYGIGGTCNHGTHNLFIADVDGDGVMEVIVGGFTYKVTNGHTTPFNASLTIWSWNNKNITLEAYHEWPGGIECVYAADADGDYISDIFTGGIFRNATGKYGSLMAWQWVNNKLSLKAHHEGIFVSSIFVADVDKDGIKEIITVGDNDNVATLCLWHLNHNNLILKGKLKLDIANATSVTSVYACDINSDGKIEIVTGGYCGSLNDSKGQLCIWSWNGKKLSLEASNEWQMVTRSYALNIAGGIMGNTIVNDLKVSDVDGDCIFEIVTGGFTYDGEKVNGQIRIWSWDGNILSLKSSQEWVIDDITEVKSISLNDVDYDSKTDIVTAGMAAAYGSFKTRPSRAQLYIWSFDGRIITLKYSKEWTIGEGTCVWNTSAADLNNDGTVEIVTSGCASINRLCDPDMRTWSIQGTSSCLNYLFLAITGLAAVVLVITFSHHK
ncbi:MAG: hypothetical protein QW175_06310 [Candidatus Bathyarchaeia archaeon]